jgi:hypothetical protein
MQTDWQASRHPASALAQELADARFACGPLIVVHSKIGGFVPVAGDSSLGIGALVYMII